VDLTIHQEQIFFRPFSIPNPLRGCNSDSAQYSNTPLLHHSAWPDSKDDYEYENESSCEGGPFFLTFPGVKNPWLSPIIPSG
jgi:hypothetical protein